MRPWEELSGDEVTFNKSCVTLGKMKYVECVFYQQHDYRGLPMVHCPRRRSLPKTGQMFPSIENEAGATH